MMVVETADCVTLAHTPSLQRFGVDYCQPLLARLSHADERCEPPKLIGVTGSRAGEGASTVAHSLAIAAAEWHGDRRVLMVDANSRFPALQRSFGADLEKGLGDYLAGRLTFDRAVRPSHLPNLSLLPVGTRSIESLTAVEGGRLFHLLEEIRRGFEFVVVDLPPILDCGLTPRFVRLLDGVLLVIEAEAVDHAVVQRTVQLLRHSRGRLLGAVLNKHSANCPTTGAGDSSFDGITARGA